MILWCLALALQSSGDSLSLAQALERARHARGSGAGAELQRPLALAVVGGLVVSTLVTLLIVPVFLEVLGELEHRRTALAPRTAEGVGQ